MPKTITVTVMPKPSVLDPQGAAVAEALKHFGLEGVARVRVGKSIEIECSGEVDRSRLEAIARDFLSNPVIEDYSVEG
ncbi:MAG: phosphoribosylformylglycinamidine synthase subunit PurS [Terrimicrobiaceae bacterium]|nr:phosphoribosylformylglycinamidine synthase subunit PurS [Terrimicrobiaceae bacterium]